MKFYQWVFYDTYNDEFTIVTAKTKLEADLKAWAFIIGMEKAEGMPIYDMDYCDTPTFEEFCKVDRCWFSFIGGGHLDCERTVIEM